jgi:hypothetical protein
MKQNSKNSYPNFYLNNLDLTNNHHFYHRVIKSKYLASLWSGWAKPFNGIFQVPSHATDLFSGANITWWAVNEALSGVHLKNPGWEIFQSLA